MNMNLNEIIKNSTIEDIIKGCDGEILQVNISGEVVYFKFLPKEFKERIEREVMIVSRLKDNNCKVPSYYTYNDKIIFEDNNQVFYGTKKVDGIPSTNHITKELLEEIMIEIARMHKVLKTINVEGKKESDIDRFKKFYEESKEFFKEHNLDTYIETVLNRTYEQEEYTYIHADINFNNIFIDNNHLSSFIDFTDLRVGYKEDDLGKLFQNILYLNLDKEFLERLISIYENELGEKVNRDNLLISVIFRLMYRYYSFVKNKEDNIEEYKIKTEKILQKII